MRVDAFDYELPPELIAQEPAPARDGSRLLVLDRKHGSCRDKRFPDLVGCLEPGDCLVLNDTRVIPARLFARRVPSGGRVEVFVLGRDPDADAWRCLLRPGRRLRPGARLALGDSADAEELRILGRHPEGWFRVCFRNADVPALLERAGRVPLPPYIKRSPRPQDRDRYQTVYARHPGAVAAPTAGLHFTSAMLDRIRSRGIGIAAVTLHVGPGTFRPVQTECVEDHVMHAEEYTLTPAVAQAINAAHARHRRVVAVGTTVVRVLETCAGSKPGQVQPGSGRTRLFLHPPYRPRIADALLTNFHLPRSTLLMLVCTFSTAEHVLGAYRYAVRERFRFYSYGDCMLVI